MELTLIVLRHGEAEDPGAAGDKRRRLVERGRAMVEDTARRLRLGGWVPVRTLVSDADRTRETWEVARPLLGFVSQVEHRADLYLGTWATLLSAVALADAAAVRCQLLVGHNPAVSDLVGELSNTFVGLRPGMAVVLTTDADSWPVAAAAGGAWRVVATFPG